MYMIYNKYDIMYQTFSYSSCRMVDYSIIHITLSADKYWHVELDHYGGFKLYNKEIKTNKWLNYSSLNVCHCNVAAGEAGVSFNDFIYCCVVWPLFYFILTSDDILWFYLLVLFCRLIWNITDAIRYLWLSNIIKKNYKEAEKCKF